MPSLAPAFSEVSSRVVNGGQRDAAVGFDIPEVTEIGFAGGLSPGSGQFFLFGLVTSRIQVERAESRHRARWSEVSTTTVPGATAGDGSALRAFVLVCPPIDDVNALVGLGPAGATVQRVGSAARIGDI
jgi:hypothetical protein